MLRQVQRPFRVIIPRRKTAPAVRGTTGMSPRSRLTLWLMRLFALLCVAAPVALADNLRLDVTRDTWVSAVGKEADGNNGGAPRLKFKGIQELSIVDVDPSPLKGKRIKRAELHLKAASGDVLRRVSISTLATEWAEGTGSGYQRQAGGASFNRPTQGQELWAYPDSDLTAATLSQGNTFWRFADATPPDKEGWQVIPVDPRVVAARVAGISHGFVVVDDVGSEYEREGERFKYKLFPNRFAFSHEQGNAKPYFVVTTEGEDRDAPATVTELRQSAGESLPAGEAVVTWTTPVDAGGAGTIGFLARYTTDGRADWDRATPLPQYLVPMAGALASRVEMRLRDLGELKAFTLLVCAIDGAGNRSAPVSCPVTLSAPPAEVKLAAAPKALKGSGELPQAGGVSVAVIDALDKVQPVTGQMVPAHPESYLHANHLWSAANETVRLYAARNETVGFQLLLKGEAKNVDAILICEDHKTGGEFFRCRSVNTKAGPMPDPLVPLPAHDRVDGETYTSILGDVHVPKDAAPGLHHGILGMLINGQKLTLAVELHVWDFALPDVLSFIPEMNCYGLPDGQELAYYRLAHAHRTNLNCLGYSWRGEPRGGGWSPKWDGKQFDWTAFDRRFGQLLDGSAFADSPRKGVPVNAIYLPINENWPLDVNEHFKGGYWADRAFGQEYERGFTAACAAFAEHFKQKGWTRTVAEFYLNNKVYYKNDKWSKCSAPWVFDEPRDAQDFWALRYYGKLFHAGVDPVRGDAQLAFRCDISYPQWQRDFLDGLLDVNVCGGSFRQYNRMVLDRKRRDGVITYTYGSSNDVDQSNVQPAAWCLDAWALGADGVVPWQTVGNEKSWKEGDALSLFYPGEHGPVASVRLKSYRRGQQDVEYLNLLSHATGTPTFAVAAMMRRELKLAGTVRKTSEDDAGTVDYGQIDPAALWALRVRVGATLDALHAKAEPRDWRLPTRDVTKLPVVGYVAS